MPEPTPPRDEPPSAASAHSKDSKASKAGKATQAGDASPAGTAPQPQAHNPLHGLTLAHIVGALQAHYGWAGLAQRVPLRCFTSEPSLNSSLKLLRKTPWAREKIESLYLYMLREQRRQNLPR